MKRLDILGQRYGRLTAIKRDGHLGSRIAWLFRCDCGAETRIRIESVRSGFTVSCGCFREETTAARSIKHGHALNRTFTKTYRAWKHAKERCNNPNVERYPRYGGRGISMHPARANDFSKFLNDLGECPDGLSIERIDQNGNYEPGNVKWASDKEQRRNRTDNVLVTHNGRQMVLKDFSTLMHVNYKALHAKVKYRGMTHHDAAKELQERSAARLL